MIQLKTTTTMINLETTITTAAAAATTTTNHNNDNYDVQEGYFLIIRVPLVVSSGCSRTWSARRPGMLCSLRKRPRRTTRRE